MRQKIKLHELRTRRVLRQLEKRYRNHHYTLPVVAVCALIFISLILITTLRDSNALVKSQPDGSNIVILHVDNETKVLPTREKTVKGLLSNAGIVIKQNDVVEPSLDAEIEEDDFRINVYRAAPVVIHDEGKIIPANSAAQTSRSIADQAGVEVYPEDEIVTEPSRDFLRDGIGSKVVIKRSVPVALNLYGSPLSIRTQASTVGELLKEKNVSVAPDDNVLPAPDTPLTDNIQVFVTRFGIQVVTTEEAIPMPIETVEDASLSFGSTAVRQAGADGKISVTYQIQTENGVEVSRTKIQEVVVQEPVKQVVARGKAFNIDTDKASVMRAAGIAESDFPYVDFIIKKESNWRVTVSNSSSGAYGLCQAMPGSKMATAGSDWQTNPVTQLKWCSGYATSRYGSWSQAHDAWRAKGWW